MARPASVARAIAAAVRYLAWARQPGSGPYPTRREGCEYASARAREREFAGDQLRVRGAGSRSGRRIRADHDRESASACIGLPRPEPGLHVEGVSRFGLELLGEVSQDAADLARETDGDRDALGEPGAVPVHFREQQHLVK